MKMNRLFYILAAAMLPVWGNAQTTSDDGDDFGTILSVEADKKINKKFSVGAEFEMRTRDDMHEVDRWSGGVSASYKLLSWLKASAGYVLLYDNNERYSYYDADDDYVVRGLVNEGDPKKYAEYWGLRHRFNVSLTGSYKLGTFGLSLRERWQYTYRPAHTVDQRLKLWDEDEDGPVYDGKQHTFSAKGKNILRSRFQVEYKIKGFPATPFANVELFNALRLEKVRYTAGAEWKINKHHLVTMYYRYQHSNDSSDDEPNRHAIGLTYNIKF